MGKRTGLYIFCLVLFPVAFAAFVVGFGCPVWIADSDNNRGLWQSCKRVFKECDSLDFDDGRDWMIGVRAVEIFALVMLSVAAAELAYETCCTNFRGRKGAERAAPGVLCILGGLGGLSGIVVYVVKMNDVVTASTGVDVDYSWAMMLVSSASGLAFLLGVGFCVSGCFLEKPDDPDKAPLHEHEPPYSTQGDSYNMTSFSNKALVDSSGSGLSRPSPNPYPGHALYNGLGGRPPSSQDGLPQEPSSYYYDRTGPPLKSSQYYSYNGEEVTQFDLSEGYLPSRPRAAIGDPYYVRDFHPREDPYSVSAAGRSEDPGYAHGRDPYAITTGGGGVPRAGYPESSRYLAARGEGRGYEDSMYRPGRY